VIDCFLTGNNHFVRNFGAVSQKLLWNIGLGVVRFFLLITG
jgi:hypothetical protein